MGLMQGEPGGSVVVPVVVVYYFEIGVLAVVD